MTKERGMVIGNKLSVHEKSRLAPMRPGVPYHSGRMPAATENLIARGFLELSGRQVSKTGRLVAAGDVRITEAGIKALAEANS